MGRCTVFYWCDFEGVTNSAKIVEQLAQTPVMLNGTARSPVHSFVYTYAPTCVNVHVHVRIDVYLQKLPDDTVNVAATTPK